MEAVAARPRKAELTLTRILDAALDCYVRQGIGATTLEDVARAAGVGRSTLYRYVDNRDDLLLKVVQRDSSLTHEAICGHVNLSSSSVRRRASGRTDRRG